MRHIGPVQLLRIIEGICLLHNDDFTAMVPASVLSDIYRIAHLASCCKSPHDDWVSFALKIEADLVASKTIPAWEEPPRPPVNEDLGPYGDASTDTSIGALGLLTSCRQNT